MKTPLGFFVVALFAPMALPGCLLSFDSFLHNARHCSVVGPETCGDQVEERRKICTPCDEDYDWGSVGIPPDIVERVDVESDDGTVNDAYFIPSSGARPEDTIVYAHGNFAGIEHYLNRVGLLYGAGTNLFVIEYRGYGKSSVKDEPSEAELVLDLETARAAVDGIEGVDPTRVFLYGYSLGGFSSIVMAQSREPCGLLLESPFVSAQSLADSSTLVAFPSAFLTSGAYDGVERIGSVDAPLLLLHGTADTFIRVEQSEVLYRAKAGPKEFVRVKGAEHGNGGDDVPTVLGTKAYLDLIGVFLDAQGCGA